MDRRRGVRVRPGDRIIASITPVCGTCWHCVRQETHLCDMNAEMLPRVRATRGDGSEANALAGIGGFADVITVDEASCVPVHTELPDEQLSLIGCGFTTGFGAAVNTAEVHPGATVAVIGAGGVGTATILGAQVAGVARIIAVDPVAMKRESARRFGATDVVDPREADAVEQVKALTDGRGVDYAFEAVGSHALELQALQMTRRGGTTVFIGVPGFANTLELPSMQLIMEDRTVKGSYYGSRARDARLPALHRADRVGASRRRLDDHPAVRARRRERRVRGDARRRGRPRRRRARLSGARRAAEGRAGVDDELAAGDLARAVGQQPHDGVGDVGGVGHPPEGHPALGLLVGLGIEGAGEHRRAHHPARVHGVHPHADRSELAVLPYFVRPRTAHLLVP